MKGIIPKVSRKAIIFSLICSVCGAILAGIYGILHDQITYSISPEYYTKLKFEQFELLNTTGSDRLKAAKIGFLATWVVGLIAGWLFGRTSYVNDNLKKSIRRVGLSFLYLISTAIIIALLASLSYHLWGTKTHPDLKYFITDIPAFLHVGWIHWELYWSSCWYNLGYYVTSNPKQKSR